MPDSSGPTPTRGECAPAPRRPAVATPVKPPNDRYVELVREIYADPRAGHPARELLLAVAFALIPGANDPRTTLRIAAALLGRDTLGQPRYPRMIAADAPRYELPNTWVYQGWCQAPRLRPYVYRPRMSSTPPASDAPTPLRRRPPTVVHVSPGYRPPIDFRNRDMVCGARSRHTVLEKDPATGWDIEHRYCARHRDHAERVAAQVAEQNRAAPEPVPNTGGLLACYFKADWATVYRRHRPGWTPPVYGIRADDWPAQGRAAAPARGLRLVVDVASSGAPTTRTGFEPGREGGSDV